jgi:chitinase
MVMDFGLNTQDMGQASVDALKATHDQLLPHYPQGAFGYGNLGFTPMIGLNDTKPETTTLANMAVMCQFAQQNGVGMLAFWDGQADLIMPPLTSAYTGQLPGSYAKAFMNCKPTS